MFTELEPPRGSNRRERAMSVEMEDGEIFEDAYQQIVLVERGGSDKQENKRCSQRHL